MFLFQFLLKKKERKKEGRKELGGGIVFYPFMSDFLKK